MLDALLLRVIPVFLYSAPFYPMVSFCGLSAVEMPPARPALGGFVCPSAHQLSTTLLRVDPPMLWGTRPLF